MTICGNFGMSYNGPGSALKLRFYSCRWNPKGKQGAETLQVTASELSVLFYLLAKSGDKPGMIDVTKH